MSSNLQSRVIRDYAVANSMIVRDYTIKHIKKDLKEEALIRHIRPKVVESCFGDFPVSYKCNDGWDGNPTMRRGMSRRYSPALVFADTNKCDFNDSARKLTSVSEASKNSIEKKLSSERASKFIITPRCLKTRPARFMNDIQTTRGISIKPNGVATQEGLSRATVSPIYSSEKIPSKENYIHLKGKYSSSFSAWKPRVISSTLFRKCYERGDLPICVNHGSEGNSIKWKVPNSELDYRVFLPVFMDGLREVEDPFRFLAVQGTLDMIEAAPQKILPVIAQIILPMKKALETRIPNVICSVLKILQQILLLDSSVGVALVPYYRQILPVFNLFKSKNVNIGDEIDYAQRCRQNVGELIQETLELLEQYGGPDAFVNIKYLIPTYQSCCSI